VKGVLKAKIKKALGPSFTNNPCQSGFASTKPIRTSTLCHPHRLRYHAMLPATVRVPMDEVEVGKCFSLFCGFLPKLQCTFSVFERWKAPKFVAVKLQFLSQHVWFHSKPNQCFLAKYPTLLGSSRYSIYREQNCINKFITPIFNTL
jgi:hypothetical protein